MSLDKKGRDLMEAIKKFSSSHSHLDVNELRIIIALERAIARIENSPKLARHLIFKGGFVLLKTLETIRFTRDLDALAFEIAQKEVPDLMIEALETNLHDGVWFGDIVVKRLGTQEAQKALRFDLVFQIGSPPQEKEKLKKLSRIHIDVGFGDELSHPTKQKMESILPSQEPISWVIYPIEYIFSEKLQTLLFRGSANSRAKDVYDLNLLFPKCDKGKILEAIKTTLKTRNTLMPKSFFSEINNLNTLVLSHAWKSIQLSEKLSFEEHWEKLLEHLKELDKLL